MLCKKRRALKSTAVFVAGVKIPLKFYFKKFNLIISFVFVENS